MNKILTLSLASLFVSTSVFANDHKMSEATEEKVRAAMKADIRTEAETERDRNRRPVQTLKFFGLNDDMKVLELLPGGGWYTKLLAPTLAEKGDFHVAIGTNRVKERLTGQKDMKFNVLETNTNIRRPEGSRFYVMDSFTLSEKDFDMVFTFRNYHNFAEEGRRAMNEAVFKALKPGGIYAVVDHTMRHMEPLNAENRRRFDPVLAIKEIQEAGFVFVEYSDLHYRADDELRYEVGRRSVSGNTDRFTFKFMKPKK
ncbi:class I SAM-dependent methyltransferase [Aliikangiella marina]|uniref:Class I SAM-dependent methyltransferase n=1 Tax=Aliikangiella marina TaxID=1712262 RepID=A0A545TJC1_9GAMM|nr:class I SAM-dependent methyltransferase [Aliikangiella marina]TQV77315.1 class I SAM-dependent methyltransferase [Aliikangiella marina]